MKLITLINAPKFKPRMNLFLSLKKVISMGHASKMYLIYMTLPTSIMVKYYTPNIFVQMKAFWFIITMTTYVQKMLFSGEHLNKIVMMIIVFLKNIHVILNHLEFNLLYIFFNNLIKIILF